MAVVRSTVTAAALAMLWVSVASATDVVIPSPKGYVTDTAGVIDVGTRERLDDLIAVTERRTSAEIAILTVMSTAPLDIFDYSVRVFDAWKIGKKGKDNGVLFVVAVADRTMRLVVGYGLEAALPDAEIGRIRDTVTARQFREGRYADAILAGTKAIAQAIERDSPPINIVAERHGTSADVRRVVTWVLIILIVAALVGQLYRYRPRMLPRRRRARRTIYRLGWDSGPGGGGGGAGTRSWSWSEGGFDSGTFGGFGGGATGGGGAGGDLDVDIDLGD